jgi:hypothetical protein
MFKPKTLIHSEKMNLSPVLQDLLQRLKTDSTIGLTSDDAAKRREEDGTFNVIKPPVDCPAWLCIILPCIKHLPAMKAFAQIRPEDAEVLRGGKWIRYDCASLVRGDIIRLEEGDIVPADCVVLDVDADEILVDIRAVAGDEHLRSATKSSLADSQKPHHLYMGGHVVQGSGTAVVTAIGPNTLLAELIKEGRFPPKENAVPVRDEGDEMQPIN